MSKNLKFSPIGNIPSISTSRFSSLSPSMKLDSLGFPHISWITVKNGHNEVHYKYWDGYNWSFIGDSSFISKSKDSIYYSPNGLTLIDDSPVIAFARKETGSNNKICVGRVSNGEWYFTELDVAYDIQWIGICPYETKIEYSSSSTGSGATYNESSVSSTSESRSSFSSSSSTPSSSSTSSSLSISESSISSITYSSSLSSVILSRSTSSSSENTPSSSSSTSSSSSSYSTSSSTSSDSSSSTLTVSYSSLSTESSLSTIVAGSSVSSSSVDSSSSTSLDNKDIFIVTYDGDKFNVYTLSSLWNMVGEIYVSIDDVSGIRTSLCGNKISIVYNNTTALKYNFFDLNDYVWTLPYFSDVYGSTTSGTIIGMGSGGYLYEEDNTVLLSWIEWKTSPFITGTLMYGYITGYGYTGSEIVDTENLSFVSNVSSGVSASHKVTALTTDTVGNPIIFASGAKTSAFYKSGSTWTENRADLDYSNLSIPKNPETIYDSISGMLKVVFDNDENEVVYFEQGSGGFEVKTPKITVLNNDGVYIANWQDTSLTIGSNVSGITAATKGCILRDAINPVVLVDNYFEIEGEEAEATSSSSTETSGAGGVCVPAYSSDIAYMRDSSAGTFLVNFRANDVPIKNDDYDIIHECGSELILQWVPYLSNIFSSFKGYFYLVCYIRNSQKKITAMATTYPWAGGYEYGVAGMEFYQTIEPSSLVLNIPPRFFTYSSQIKFNILKVSIDEPTINEGDIYTFSEAYAWWNKFYFAFDQLNDFVEDPTVSWSTPLNYLLFNTTSESKFYNDYWEEKYPYPYPDPWYWSYTNNPPYPSPYNPWVEPPGAFNPATTPTQYYLPRFGDSENSYRLYFG